MLTIIAGKPVSSPFQSVKRQQATSILSQTTKASFVKTIPQTRAYSSEMANALVQVSQNIGMGSAAIGLGGKYHASSLSIPSICLGQYISGVRPGHSVHITIAKLPVASASVILMGQSNV